MSEFSKLIKEKRLAMNMSLRYASRQIGISYTYLSNLEKGVDQRTGFTNKPTPETLQMIATAYKLDYTYLLQLWGYIQEMDLSLSPNLQELIAACKKMSADDIKQVTQYANFINWQNLPPQDKESDN